MLGIHETEDRSCVVARIIRPVSRGTDVGLDAWRVGELSRGSVKSG